MAKIPLRVYNKDIDQLVENGQIAEAIAHCKYILKAFPKHIDTYRLLGQAYLTNQRYTEAADILQRVLSVIPDDFISQIGMSIIREDEGNLDAAIYHMEKAFEVQPAKSAIQSELRRLYGRRDGMEPPKIRLTRGALVRMYLRGELYPQAIAEVRAALADDPNQLDLQVILAKLYDLSGQKVQAVEICSRLVGKLPYCLEANRILAEVLPGTSRADDAKVFKDRIVAIDPYAAFVQAGQNDSASVSDAAVQIERLEYNAAADVSEQPEWTQTVGVAWDDKETSEAAAWMEETKAPAAEAPGDTSTPTVEEETAAPAEIPEWMAAAGWAASTGAAEETPMELTEEEPAAEGGLVTPGEIPDWLQNLAPETPVIEEPAVEASEEDEAWLEKMMGETPAAAAGVAETPPEESVPQAEAPALMWEEKPAEATDISEALLSEAQETELPDWLKNMGGETETPAAVEAGAAAPAEQEEALPDWLQSLGEETAATDVTAAATSETSAEVPAAEEAALPDWLQNLESESEAAGEAPQAPAEEVELPEWLQGLGEESQSVEETSQEQPVGEIPAQPSEELPDWLKAGAGEQPVEELPAEEAEALPEWLQQVQAEETEASLPEIKASPKIEMAQAEEEASAPDAVATEEIEQAVAEVAPAEPTAETPVTEPAVPELNPEEDLDSALAWLESLAAKQGANEAELLTQPEQRGAEMPTWIKEEAQPVEEKAGGKAASELPEARSEIEAVSAETEPGEAAGALVFETELQEAAGALIFEAPQEREETVEAVAEMPVEEEFQPAEAVEMPVEEATGAVAEVPLEAEGISEEALSAVEQTPTAEEVEAVVADQMTTVETVESVEEVAPTSLEEQPGVEMEQPEPLSAEELAAAVEETKPVRVAPPAAEAEEVEQAEPETAETVAEAPAMEETAPEMAEMAVEEIPLEVGEPTAELPAVEEAEAEAPVEAKVEPVVIEEVPPVEAAAATTAPVEAGMPEDLDSALAWLESLAAKQGAEEETLLTSPESRLETPPEWVTTEAAQAQPPAEPAAEFDEPASMVETTEAMEEVIEASEVEEAYPVSESPAEAVETETVETPAPPAMEGWSPEIETVETGSASEEALPDWLQSLAAEEEALPESEAGALPEWLQELEPSEEPVAQAVSAGEWTPESAAEEAPETTVEAVVEEVTQVEEVETPAVAVEEETQPVPVAAAQLVESIEEAPTAPMDSDDLERARKALDKGEIESALECYATLTERGAQLEEVIHDLRDATYRFPVNSDIWQALGDAYRQGNHVQDALDAYTKAIELLR